jgi:hypothetical protein
MTLASVLRDGASRRDYVRGGFLWITMVLLVVIAPSAAAASTYRWQFDASGNWNNPANWEVVEGPAGAGYPNVAGDVAVFDEPLTAARTITIPDGVTITIGRLTVTPSNAAGQVTIARTGTGLLAFDNQGDDAVIETSGPGGRTVMSAPIRLAAHVIVDGAIDFSSISESVAARNVTIAGGSVTFIQENTYTGTTTVAEGELITSGSGIANLIPGPLVVGDGTGAAASAVGRIGANSIAYLGNVRVNRDGSVLFSGESLDGLTIAGGRVSIEGLYAGLSVQHLTMEGGELMIGSDSDGVNNSNSLRLFTGGSLTATSTAAGPAVIRSPVPVFPGFEGFVSFFGNREFTIGDGPAAVDFLVERTRIDPAPGTSLIKRGAGVMQTNSTSPYSGTRVIAEGELWVNGSHPTGEVQVDALGTLGGFGTVGPITVAANGTVAPGTTTVGTLNGGSIAFTAGAHFAVEIASAASYDRLNVTGSVNLGNATLDVTSASLVAPTAVFTIIDNDGSDAVVGTFVGLAEGSTFIAPSGASFTVSYQGGDGNDVTLTNVTPVTYFLSEGATGTFFDEDVLIANPNTVPAPVTMTFFLPGGGTMTREAIVPAQSRLTVEVDEIDGLEATTPSVEVRSDNRLTLAVERSMFWDSTHYGGHTANSVPRAERQWFFAEGAQNDFFNTYLLLANPNGAMTAKVTFLRESEPPFVLDVPLQAASRTTIYAGDHAELVGRSFGITIEAPEHITAERAMYFATTPQRFWSGGHDNVGSPAPSTSWFHPEGASGTFFSTFILMSNPQTEPATVTLRFLLPGGGPVEITKTIPAQARLTVNPAAEGIAALQNASFSTVVASSVPIVSERAMYWSADDTVFGEGHASSGLTDTALSWTLAEGRVGGSDAYTTYILLANPQSTDASVKVTFLRETGEPVVKEYPVAANTRFNIDVGGMVPELQNESFGALIEVTNDVPIAVERSMYWNVEGRFWSGGTNAVGSVVPR